MMINLGTLGRRLREARTNCGVTQEAAAAKLGVPRTAIVHVEAGNRSISVVELSTLADLYNRSIADLVAEEAGDHAAEDDLVVTLYRSADEFKGHPSIEQEVARAVGICKEGTTFQKFLGSRVRSGPPVYYEAEPETPIIAMRQGYLAAAEERKRLAMGDGPVHQIAEMISSQGVWVAELDLPDEVSGLLLRKAAVGTLAVVNRNHPRARKRFSYAHEYAHAVLDRSRAAIVSTSSNSRNLTETRANAFAAGFLMPEAGVRSFLSMLNKGGSSRVTETVYSAASEDSTAAQDRNAPGTQKITFQDIASLARFFGTSYQAAAYRLGSLGVITPSEQSALLEQKKFGNGYLRLLNSDQWTDDDESPSDSKRDGAGTRALARQVVYLAIESYRRGGITKGALRDLARKLGVNAQELLALAEAAV
jgi:Zn-dependent peptidase ImmA (M78 family)/transcriptional regulator with XRE-family HTH domain